MNKLLGFLIGMLYWMACTGCTTYDIIRKADGSTEVHVKSWRSFQDVALKYSRDGEIVGFQFGAASVVSQTPLDAVVEGIKFGVQIATGKPAASTDGE